MIALLFWVIVLGLFAWGISAIPIPQPFKTIAWVILCLILVVVIFHVFFGYAIPGPLLR